MLLEKIEKEQAIGMCLICCECRGYNCACRQVPMLMYFTVPAQCLVSALCFGKMGIYLKCKFIFISIIYPFIYLGQIPTLPARVEPQTSAVPRIRGGTKAHGRKPTVDEEFVYTRQMRHLRRCMNQLISRYETKTAVIFFRSEFLVQGDSIPATKLPGIF